VVYKISSGDLIGCELNGTKLRSISFKRGGGIVVILLVVS
jgi:hypothetical protein